ncbi:regulator of microtubule dynamics protein 3 [Anoplopoma fimbria]|uniref:regulator of microtubule dynamics protein 3 n=1 Tax=Anoplopoma fimbria TaxID=229290 RepID=UPI0023EA8A75|nr:regulator of microtubule dynamics protein 3 [Anoplopoma fimbria]XP_054473986.1 regulator of microtubule dynamics protein 3 [Anoplopoma fimbria]XP_054473987.1 regulator of microtubule dynamics protein 3 [Anoplopoma fimbria]
MSAPRLIGVAVGVTAGCGLIALIIYREISRRRARALLLEARPQEEMPLRAETVDAPEVEAQQQALAAVEAVVQGLSPEQQLELRNQLDQVLNCVSSLRSEVAELRGGLQDIAVQIIQDVKKGVEDSQRVRRRRHVTHRERTDSTGSSSIYFTASQGMTSTYETSEGGYSTAYAESDYTDRDTDKEEGEEGEEGEAEPEQESEEDEDKSCATVLTIRQEDSQEDEAEERGLLLLEEDEEEEDEEEDDGRLQQLVTEVPSGELALLLAQSDILHTGDAKLKAEGFRLLLDNRAAYGDSREFLWRLARAYSDMYECTEDKQEKKTYAQQGRDEAELALKKNGLNAECHKWFAVLTGMTSKHESMHSKLKSSNILKEHLDRAIALRDDDPMCFYLLGRWCYEVANLDWLEKKAAAALYQSPPSSTLHDALENFLKAEELSPAFSKTVRLYIAKCHKELGNISEATNWVELALKTPTNSKDDETSNLEAQLRVLTERKI